MCYEVGVWHQGVQSRGHHRESVPTRATSPFLRNEPSVVPRPVHTVSGLFVLNTSLLKE